MLGLTTVIELFPQAVGHLAHHLGQVDRAIHAFEQAQHGLQLAHIGFHGARHVRVLQLARNPATIVHPSVMHLSKRSGM